MTDRHRPLTIHELGHLPPMTDKEQTQGLEEMAKRLLADLDQYPGSKFPVQTIRALLVHVQADALERAAVHVKSHFEQEGQPPGYPLIGEALATAIRAMKDQDQ